MARCGGQHCDCVCGNTGSLHRETSNVHDAKSSPETRLDTFRLENLDCADCAVKLEKRVAGIPGVRSARINFGAGKLVVTHNTRVDIIIKAVNEAGYRARLSGFQEKIEDKYIKIDLKTVLTTASGLFLVTGFAARLFDAPHPFDTLFFLAAILSGGLFIGRSAVFSIKNLSLDMNVLMCIAVIGAMAIGEWTEGATAVFLFSLGNALQAYSMEKSRKSIKQLMALSPRMALVKRNGTEELLPVEEIQVGDLLIVKPGERIAMDGVVLRGSSRVNQSPITGESMPVRKKAGSQVFAGTLNEDGVMEIKVTHLVQDTTLAKIVEMVEEAQAQRAPSQQFVDVFARYYTPAVIAVAITVAALPPVIWHQPLVPWLEKALILLVTACPCALVISTPVAIVTAIGSAARRGVLVKGGIFLEEAGTVKAVAFDKTGTLTEGKPEVTDVIPIGKYTNTELLRIAVSVESRSQHPLAGAVLRYAASKNLEPAQCSDIQSIPGEGIKAVIEGKEYFAGNAALFTRLGINISELFNVISDLQEQGKTIMLVGTRESVMGLIAVSDRVRPESTVALNRLRHKGIKRIVMLTGDNTKTARAIARQAGVDEYKAGLLPGDKMRTIKELQERYGKVAMVGDGVNDAPALAVANIGIAMGRAGTDTALETADIALMSDDLSKIPYIIELSRRALKVIKQNIAFSIMVKFVFILGTFAGVTNLWMAVFADTGASLLVIVNAMRLILTGDTIK